MSKGPKSIGERLWGLLTNLRTTGSFKTPTPPKSPIVVNYDDIPRTRQSSPPAEVNYQQVITDLNKTIKPVNPQFSREVIPLIRKLVMVNPDISQALDNYVTLGNTGHKIHFDRNVPDEYANRMRTHIINRHKDWAPGCAGADGLVNKMFTQVLIAGALSNEWVPSIDLKGIEACIMVPPETILAALNSRKTGYDFYQLTQTSVGSVMVGNNKVKKLNPLTYKYYALNGDGETPYGFPPYMAALDRIEAQGRMNANIDHVTELLGLLGFMEVLVAVRDQKGDEGDAAYMAHVQNYLKSAKDILAGGLKEGVMVGVKDLHTFKFNSIAHDFDKVIELYRNNELQIGSGLKMDMSLMGRDYNTSESQITVIFMKMLSQLKNIQNIIKSNLEYGYSMELRLAGFKFEYLTVEFDRSTIQDDLKYQQAEEIKIRNIKDKYLLGIISTKQGALELGYENVDKEQPRVPDELIAGSSPNNSEQAQKKKERKDQKNKSSKKGRDKNKPQGSKKQ